MGSGPECYGKWAGMLRVGMLRSRKGGRAPPPPGPLWVGSPEGGQVEELDELLVRHPHLGGGKYLIMRSLIQPSITPFA